MTEIVSRRKTTSDRLATIKVDLADSANLSKGKACVYATGSFGRGEAGKFSDLDLFIVGKGPAGKSDLRRLDEICIKADLIEVTKKNGLPEFSGDGRYLIHYSVGDLVKTVGTPEDDALNTFTARLLLLLESKPLVESDVYLEIIDEIIIAYWRDYEDHKSSFMPAYLANDILRLWRTFCVNYEARSDREPDFEKARGKIKNYKLKHSRLLTCFSAIIYLLAIFNKSNTVHPTDATAMVAMTPTERLEALLSNNMVPTDAVSAITSLLNKYEKFLGNTNRPEAELVEIFLNKTTSTQMMKDANEFGDSVYDVLDGLKESSKFYRMIVV
jgi:predicted nucleotidyltransferase